MAFETFTSSFASVKATGATAINLTTAEPAAAKFKPLYVTVHLSSAPTTSENLVITKNAAAGADYDTVFRSVDLSLSSATDFVYEFGDDIVMLPGDQVVVTYTNTDARTYGVEIVFARN